MKVDYEKPEKKKIILGPALKVFEHKLLYYLQGTPLFGLLDRQVPLLSSSPHCLGAEVGWGWSGCIWRQIYHTLHCCVIQLIILLVLCLKPSKHGPNVGRHQYKPAIWPVCTAAGPMAAFCWTSMLENQQSTGYKSSAWRHRDAHRDDCATPCASSQWALWCHVSRIHIGTSGSHFVGKPLLYNRSHATFVWCLWSSQFYRWNWSGIYPVAYSIQQWDNRYDKYFSITVYKRALHEESCIWKLLLELVLKFLMEGIAECAGLVWKILYNVMPKMKLPVLHRWTVSMDYSD